MQATLEGTTLTIQSDHSDKWSGKTTALYVLENHSQAGRCLQCGRISANGKRQNLFVRLADKPDLRVLVDEWIAAKKAIEEQERITEEQERERIIDGRTVIECTYCDGEYLSGYVAPAIASELLVAIGAASHVSGWGTHIDPDLIQSLGPSFSYPQAVEFTRPRREAEGRAKGERDAETQSVFAKASATGERQALCNWVTDRCYNGNDDECSFDSATEWALPDGSRNTTYTCCY